ncbi:oligosaccharide flippase family protein [Vibrio parahaemolyticus]|nr:oligosaccharide flippase family protein [Vibrio parahaemolyticus]
MLEKLILRYSKNMDNHTKTRNFRLLLSIATAGLTKVVGIGSTLITMPITLDYLGTEKFGIWMVISGIVAFMSFSDLGIGVGLQNALSKAYGRNDMESPRFYIGNAYILSVSISAMMIALVFLGGDYIPISSLFNITDLELIKEVKSTLILSFIIFISGIPISMIQRVLNGYQCTYITNNIQLVGKLLGMISIFLVVYLDLGLIFLTSLFIASPLIVQFLYSIYFFVKKENLIPKVVFSKKFFQPIISAGLWTVFAQIIFSAKMNVPVLIISSALGLIAVTEYSIAMKLISVASLMITMALQPLWTVYGEAFYRDDKIWVRNTLYKSLKIVLLLTSLSAALFIFLGQGIIEFWLNSETIPPRMMIICFSCWMIASNINVCFAMLLNGTGNFRNQTVFSFCFILIALVLSYIFTPSYNATFVIFIMFAIGEVARIPFFYFESKRIIESIKD